MVRPLTRLSSPITSLPTLQMLLLSMLTSMRVRKVCSSLLLLI
nr:MAG TPA: hypothetical protein [Caudoviricetes sp.]